MTLRDGRYYGQLDVASTRATKSKTKGTPQIELTFTVGHIQIDQEYQGLPGGPVQAIVYLSLHENAKQYTMDKLEALGCTGMNPFGFTKPGCELVLKNHPQYGERWDIGGGEPTPMDERELTELDALWKSRHPQAPIAAAPAAPADMQPAANVPGPTSGDAIPF